MSTAKPKAADTANGVILPDCLYSLTEIRKRTGMGSWAIRKARKDGLAVKKIGNSRFVLGREFIRFVEEVGTEDD